MLNKLQLNNELHKRKPEFLKAKNNLINKLVKKLRKLKKYTQKFPENLKFHSKLRKNTETLDCVKKQKPLRFLKDALTFTKDPKKIITNSLSTPEEMADAQLILHPYIEKSIKEIKAIFQLNELSIDCESQLKELSKKQKKILRTKRKQFMRQEKKRRNYSEHKRNQWLEKNATVKVYKNAEADNGPIQKFKEWSVTPLRKNIFTQPNACIYMSEKQCSNEPSEIPEVASVSSSKNEKDESLDDARKPAEEDNVIKSVIDSFFITQTGDNYLSTAVIARTQPILPNDGLVRKERRATLVCTKSKMHKKKQINRNSVPSKSASGARMIYPKPSWRMNNRAFIKTHEKTTIKKIETNGNQKESIKRKFVFDSKNTAEKLHPSWIAKQKLKPKISEFQGKRIVFRDD